MEIVKSLSITAEKSDTTMIMRVKLKQTQVLIMFLGVFILFGPGIGVSHAQKKGKAKLNAGAADGSSAIDNSESEYRVGPGDVIEISVWKEPEASAPAVVIRPDGKLSLPLVNDLFVNGKTPMEIQAMLAEKLEPYIKEPNVTVTVKEIKSKKVYVLGQVMHPGVFDIAQPTTVLQVLTLAGGPQPFAKLKSIYVLRTEGGKQEKLPFNYKEVVKGKKIEQNVQLKPGDNVVVP